MHFLIKTISSHPPKAWIVLGFSLAVTWLAWSVSNGFVIERAKERFQFEAQDLQIAINNRLRDQEKVLQGGVGLFAASKHVSRDEWRKFTKALDVEPQQVVPVDPESTDWRLVFYSAMGSMPIIHMRPKRQVVRALI